LDLRKFINVTGNVFNKCGLFCLLGGKIYFQCSIRF
jgi:hypothetical protein